MPGLKTKDTEAGSVPEIEKKYTLATPRKTSQAVTTEKAKPAQNVRSEMEILRTKEDADKFESKRLMNIQRNKNMKPPRSRSLYSFANYKPLKNSPPIMAGINASLISLNNEFSAEKKEKVLVARRYQKFDAKSANRMEIVGNIKVGEVVPDSSARHIVIVTTWRSGSTFLGDLLNHYKGVFYYFEPLHYYAQEKDKVLQTRTDFLSSLLKCQFNKENLGFLHHAQKPANKFLFKNHNFRMWNSCQNVLPNDMMCYLPEYLNKACPLYPIKLIKTVRLQLEETEQLIKDPALGLKVLFLVRDPRGTYNSRSSSAISNWCTKDQCSDPQVGCKNMADNIDAAFDLERRYPGTVKLVRYEDLSMYPEDVVTDMLDFLNLPMIEEIDKYIETHTNSEKLRTVRNKKTHKIEHKKNPYGTTKNSTATAYAWRDSLTFDHIQQIQTACQDPMKRLGYQLLKKPEDTKNVNLPIDSNLETIWPFK